MSEDEEFDPTTATDEQLTLYLARQGVSPMDLQRSLDKALCRIEWLKRDERSWEEFELERPLTTP